MTSEKGSETHGAPARRYSPVVQRIAAEHGIDLGAVSGSGRGGRVRKQHIESPYRPDPVPVTGTGQLSRMRRQIGAHMKRSLETAAHCTTWIEVDMTRVQTARSRLGVTALSFVAGAVIAALREHPQLNATLEGERYTQHADINLGIAVSLGDDGLIVPVIHRAHELSVEGLAARIRDLATRARARELKPDEVRGGTFTITNPGQYGSIMATPIINQPQVAILDLEAIVKRPVVVTDADGNDSIAIRAMTILGLSWDHRALDGALSERYLTGDFQSAHRCARARYEIFVFAQFDAHVVTGKVAPRAARSAQQQPLERAPQAYRRGKRELGRCRSAGVS